MKTPSQIVDLHTHLFNARYLPLDSIIAHAMNREESALADAIAKLIVRLTGSSFKSSNLTKSSIEEAEINGDEHWLNELWNATDYELRLTTRSSSIFENGPRAWDSETKALGGLDSLLNSDLYQIILTLAGIDYRAEGIATTPTFDAHAGFLCSADKKGFAAKNLFGWAESVVKFALLAVVKLMDPHAWGKAENYLEFFFMMMHSEEKIIKKLLKSYRPYTSRLQIVHQMMDMQLAYRNDREPYYAFHPTQLGRMQLLHRSFPNRVFGFSAFDPRRSDWLQKAEKSLSMGFVGFKFYPAMEYKPIENPDSTIQLRIENFFDFCVDQDRDIPVFVHCTPEGFQTRNKLGCYAHPKYWRAVLETPRWSKLRLCLGHAGGDRFDNSKVPSAGWLARNEDEWNDPDNFARIVADLCARFPNVYCEFGYITDLFDINNRQTFLNNLATAASNSQTYNFMDKVAYGSDWHMPSMVDNNAEYLRIFIEILNEPQYQRHLERFFWKTAYRYLKLPA